MGFWDFGFGFIGGPTPADELPEIFPLGVLQKDFVEIDVENIYSKILTDVVERTDGIPEDNETMLWDNCLKSEKCYGLITLLAKAMSRKSDLYLVVKAGVLRRATADEESVIRADYEKQAQSNGGVYVSFTNYRRTDMIRIYSALEYCTVASLNKSMNLSKAIQFKINDLRSTVALSDASVAKAQAMSIACGLKNGKDVTMDGKDTVETASPDTAAAKTSMELFNAKRAFYLNMPSSYITGELNSGLGDTGKADSKAIERGLRGYFASIVKPVVEALFQSDVDFKSEDYDDFQGSLEALKTFDITSDEYLSADSKLKIINRRFGLDPDTEGGPPEPVVNPLEPKQDPPPAQPVVVPPVAKK